MAFRQTIRIGALAVAVAMGSPSGTSTADVPVSVAVRRQPPDVEEIIGQLETKTANTEGTWRTKAGHEDVPAIAWETTLDGQKWSWRSQAGADQLLKGYTLYCDGEDCFSVPDDLRFQNDVLTQGKFHDFRLGEYLLMLNFEPRQMIASLGGLKKLENVDINGVSCAHLHADLSDDPLLKSDTAVSGRTALLPIIDIFIDLQIQTVRRVVYIDRGGIRYQTDVTAWDSFGTSGTWPKKLITNAKFVDREAGADVEKPFLTSVEGFQARQVDQIKTIADSINKEKFFAAPRGNIRSAEFYRKALETDPSSTSDKVALVQAAFNEEDPTTAMATWNQLETELTSPEDRARLRVFILPHACYTLWGATKQQNQVDASVAVMQRLLADLTPEEQRANSASLCAGWEILFTNPKTRPALEPINAKLLGLLAAHGDQYTCNCLAVLSHNKDYQTVLAPWVKTVSDEAIPTSGYQGSTLSYLVAAELQLKDFEAAKALLNAPNWASDTPDAVKSIAGATLVAIEESEALHRLDAGVFPKAIVSFDAFGASPFSQDKVTAGAVRGTLVLAGLHLFEALMASGDEKAQLLLTSNAKVPGAEAFWDRLLHFAGSEFRRDPKFLTTRMGPVFGLFEKTFQRSGYQVRMWTALARSYQGYLGVQTEFFNKGLVVASTDSDRYAVIEQMASTYGLANEYTAGAQAVNGASEQLKDPAYVAKAKHLAETLIADGDAQLARARDQEKQIQQRDHDSQLDALRTLLARKKQAGANATDLASLEQTINAMASSAHVPQQ